MNIIIDLSVILLYNHKSEIVYEGGKKLDIVTIYEKFYEAWEASYAFGGEHLCPKPKSVPDYFRRYISTLKLQSHLRKPIIDLILSKLDLNNFDLWINDHLATIVSQEIIIGFIPREMLRRYSINRENVGARKLAKKVALENWSENKQGIIPIEKRIELPKLIEAIVQS